MKAKDLIKILEKYPEFEISVSVDVSTNDEDFDKRAFGDNILEIIHNNSNKSLTLCLDGYLNK